MMPQAMVEEESQIFLTSIFSLQAGQTLGIIGGTGSASSVLPLTVRPVSVLLSQCRAIP